MSMTGYNLARLYDLKGKRNIDVEVNFSENPDFKDTLRVKMGSEDAIIPIKELYALVFAVANQDQQADLVPVTQTEVVKYLKFHTVKAKTDIKKDQLIKVRCEINVPTTVVNALNGSIGKTTMEKSKHSIILPA